MPRRPLSDEEKAIRSQRMKARWAARKAAPEEERATVAVAEPQDPFAKLEATLAESRARRQRLIQIVNELEENPSIADDPEVAAMLDQLGIDHPKRKTEGIRPGTRPVVSDGKGGRMESMDCVDWKESDLTHPEWGCVDKNGNPMYVTFTPNETIPVFYNGIRCQLIADQEITCLKCFKDVYDEHKRAQRIAEEHKQYMFGRSDYLPAELRTSDAAVATARVRAFMSMGGEKGGGRIVAGYPGDQRFELRDVPGATSGENSGETNTAA